jgi:uncharacterized membrane protein (TIGR02234 family)
MTEPDAGLTGESQPGEEPQKTRRDGGRNRRLAIIAVLLGLAAVAYWAASRMTWAELIAADGMAPPRTFTVKGSQWTLLLTPLAIVLLAAIAAAASLRGWALRITAIIVAAVAVLGVLPAITLLTGDDHTSYAAKVIDMPSRYQPLEVDTSVVPGIVVLLGALAAVLGAVVMLQTAARDAPMSSKYKSPAARRAELEEQVFAQHAAEQKSGRQTTSADTSPASATEPSDNQPEGAPNNERMLWDALDTGDDPTIGPSER